jgi:hypothetical protein
MIHGPYNIKLAY